MSASLAGRLVPLLSWLPAYRSEWLRYDVVAGLTAAAVVVPKGLAYATIAAVPLSMGLNACVVPMLVYVLLGTSRTLSVSTTSTIAILMAAGVAGVAPEGSPAALAAPTTLALLVGVLLLAALALRLSFLADFISEPVLTGFKAGIGVIIVLDQLPKLLGIHVHKTGLVRDAVSILRHVPETSLVTLALSAATLALMVLLPRVLPRAPAPLLAIAAGIAASKLLSLPERGVSVVGEVPLGLPSLTLPDLALAEALWPAAAGIALISFTESIAAGRAFVREGDPRPRAGQELFAVGAGNVAAGLLGTMPSGGGTSQTAVNFKSGARSQVSAAVTAAAAIACLLVLGPALGALPNATLAAVVIATSIGLVQPAEFRAILAIRRTEFAWAVAAFAGVALLGTLKGILVAVVVSLGCLMAQAQNPPVYPLVRKRGTNVFRPASAEHPDDETIPGLVLLRVDGRLFFGNAQRVADRLAPLVSGARGSVVVLDCSGILDLEYTALKMLTEGEERMRSRGVLLCLAAMNPEVRRVVEASPLGRALGRERTFFNLEQAVAGHGLLLERARAAAGSIPE